MKNLQIVTLTCLAASLAAAHAHAGVTPAERARMVQAATEAARQKGLPACFAYVIAHGESGGNYAVLGHDENYPRDDKSVRARSRFLRSGQKYSGARFTPSEGPNSRPVSNDDGAGAGRKYADLGDWPDYEIDWRFTHGFGLGQVTFGGETGCTIDGRPAGESCMVGGKARTGTFCREGERLVRGTLVRGVCRTVPWLLSPEGGVTAMIHRLAAWYRVAREKVRANPNITVEKCKTSQYRADAVGESVETRIVRATFAAYGAGGGLGDTCRPAPRRRVVRFRECERRGAGGVGPSGPSAPSGPDSPDTPSAPPRGSSESGGSAPSLQGLYGKFKDWLRSAQESVMSFLGRGAYVTGWIYLRSGPSSRAKPIRTLPKCAEVRIVGKMRPWIEVRYGSERGYVHSDYVRPGSRRDCRR